MAALTAKVAIVTGSSHGIGRGIAERVMAHRWWLYSGSEQETARGMNASGRITFPGNRSVT